MNKRLAMLIAVIMSLISLSYSYAEKKNQVKTDRYIRDRVLMLKSSAGTCSAIEVRSESGKVYTLSAAHCSIIAKNDYVNAISEAGDEKLLKVLRIDEQHDLMLLEGFDNHSIEIAKSAKIHDRVHTLTHGKGMPTYRTDGELLDIEQVIVREPVFSEDNAACKTGELVVDEDGLSCQKKEYVRESTASTVPGSSGGAVLNTEGQLVGIVSCGDGIFSGFVPLEDIKAFVKGL